MKNGSGYIHKNIKTFGIIPSENPNSKRVPSMENRDLLNGLKKSLKQDGYIWVSQPGGFGSNKEHSLFVFNICLDTLRYFAEKYQQTSFFFCEIVKDGDVQQTKSSFYQVHDDGRPYDKRTNPHELLETTIDRLTFCEKDASDAYSKIGEKFEYTFPMKCFRTVEDELSKNISKYFSDRVGDVVDSSINTIGYYALSIRHRLNEGITDKLNGMPDNFSYLPFEDYSDKLKTIKSDVYKCEVKQYDGCYNNNLILEGSFNRLVSQMENKDFAIISAYRNHYTKKENILRNRNLREILNRNHMGVIQLVGHWLEAPKEKTDSVTPKNELERSYFVVKHDNISWEEFKKIMSACLTIDTDTQECGIMHEHGGKYFCLYPHEELEEIGDKITYNKVSQAYAEYVLKSTQDHTFVFEGVEIPGSNSGCMMFKNNNIYYI